MYDDFPEPPPAPPACPNCNEELTDDPATPEAALAEWVANNGADRLPIAKAVRS